MKRRKFTNVTIRKQTAQGVCFMNERQSNSLEHEDFSRWQRLKNSAVVTELTEGRTMKFQAWFTAMTGDRHDELATMYLRMIAVRGSDSMDCKTF